MRLCVCLIMLAACGVLLTSAFLTFYCQQGLGHFFRYRPLLPIGLRIAQILGQRRRKRPIQHQPLLVQYKQQADPLIQCTFILDFWLAGMKTIKTRPDAYSGLFFHLCRHQRPNTACETVPVNEKSLMDLPVLPRSSQRGRQQRWGTAPVNNENVGILLLKNNLPRGLKSSEQTNFLTGYKIMKKQKWNASEPLLWLDPSGKYKYGDAISNFFQCSESGYSFLSQCWSPCCGSWSRILCLFDPWIWDPE